jgi:hypothetical protein
LEEHVRTTKLETKGVRKKIHVSKPKSVVKTQDGAEKIKDANQKKKARSWRI